MFKKKWFGPVLWAAIIGVGLTWGPGLQASAADKALKNGEYTLDYNILKAENDSVSMANDYFEKPARIYVKDSKIEMEIQLNHSEWITDFKTARGSSYSDVRVISNNAAKDTRVVRFPVESLSTPLKSQIHVTVPSVDYDHDYTIRFDFKQDSLTQINASQTAQKSSSASGTAASKDTKVSKDVKAASGSAPAASASTESKQSTDTKVVSSSSQVASSTGGQAAGKASVAESQQSGAVAANTVNQPIEDNPHTGDEVPYGWLLVGLAVSALFIGRTVLAAKK
ncbi:heme uptake protein IsdC [Paenibacillus sp. FSL K6-1230]|uniref:heme uptake protein IsdC n=1 Tax=Paenibacillus sp. FSL K6-1230 TaxID=2921603 RepID=UPI0003A3C87D